MKAKPKQPKRLVLQGWAVIVQQPGEPVGVVGYYRTRSVASAYAIPSYHERVRRCTLIVEKP